MSQSKDHRARLPSESDILEAVRKSGYLMDQEVATVLENLGFHVQTSWPFEDPDEGESRELDVWAGLTATDGLAPNIAVELFCECKQSEERPFVFIARRRSRLDLNVVPTHYICPLDRYERRLPSEGNQIVMQSLDGFRFFQCGSNHYWFKNNDKAVQLAKIVPNKDKWEAQHDGVYNSLLLPLAKALTHERRRQETFRQPAFRLCFPLVVLKAPIYRIIADVHPLVVERVPYISFYRKLDARSVKGDYITDFVTFEALPQLVNDHILPFVNSVAERYRANPRQFIAAS